jgi:hypothetical protein
MSRQRYTVYRETWDGMKGDWLVLDNLSRYAIAKCDSRSDARRVAEALNEYEAAP